MSSISQSSSFLSKSLGKLRESSTCSSYVINRNLVKIGFDSVHLFISAAGSVQQFISANIKEFENHAGDFFNYVSVSLGKNGHTKLQSDKKLVLEEINYCKKELQNTMTKEILREFGVGPGVSEGEVGIMNKMASQGLINHHYLVLKLTTGSGEELHIRAHKVRQGDKGEIGVIVDLIQKDKLLEDLNQDVISYKIKCAVHIPLDSLYESLEPSNKEDLDYCHRDKNCWDYACKTTTRLLAKCVAVVGISPQEKERLQKEMDGLKGKLVERTFANKMELFKKIIVNSS